MDIEHNRKSAATVPAAGGYRRYMIRGTLGSFGIRVGNKVLALATTVLLAKVLGASGFGIYANAMAWIALITVFSALGFPTLVLRELSTGLAASAWARMRGILRFSGFAVMVVSVLSAAAGAILAAVVFQGEGSMEMRHALWTAMALVPLISIGKLRKGALRGLHHVLLAQVPELILRPAGLLVMTLAVLALAPAFFTAQVAVWLQVIATFLAFITGTVWLWRRLPSDIRTVEPQQDANSWMRSACHLLLYAGMSTLLTQTGIVALGIMSTMAAAGAYALSVRGSEVILIFLAAINIPLMPLMARLHVDGSRAQLQRTLTKATMYALGAALPVAVILVLGAGPILAYFGDGFLHAKAAFQILVLSQLLNVAFGPVGSLLNVTGYERHSSHGLTAAAVFNVLLCIVLIPIFEVTGAAIASLASTVFWNIWLTVVAHRKLHLKVGLLGHARI